MKHFPLKCLLIFFFFSAFQAVAQKESLLPIIKNYLQENHPEFSSDDLKNIEIVNYNYSKSTEAFHVYVNQKIEQIPIFKSLGNFTIKNNRVVFSNNNFFKGVDLASVTTQPFLNAKEAIRSAAEQLQINVNELIYKSQEGDVLIFDKGNFASRDIKAKLVYFPTEEKVALSWNINYFNKDDSHWWDIVIDAQTGKIIFLNDWMHTCNFGEEKSEHASYHNKNQTDYSFGFKNLTTIVDNASYNVFPLPLESPDDGARQLISNPANIVASPFGWHDEDGITDHDYTTTQGNNVHAFENRDAEDFGFTYIDGGSTLTFDFPFDANQNPIGYIDTSVTNLFYWNNIMHDVLFLYGFDEASGNFQTKNYTGVSGNLDHVYARGQYAADYGPFDNASFGTPPDGENPSMQMFTWSTNSVSHVLEINDNSSIDGNYNGEQSSFGPNIPTTGIIAQISIVIDNNSSGSSTDAYDACDNIINGSVLNGKIAIIRRGECNFTNKVYKAQEEGAVAVVMVNNVNGTPFSMQGNPTNPITIPSVMINKTQGENIISALESGENIQVKLVNPGPTVKDGSLDATVIAHEYGHGLSTRLVGGASNTSCLFSDEQMGEGWSDFLSLILTMKASDLATDARGIGTYAKNQGLNGVGIRPAPYSTDFSINGFTYDDTNNPNLSMPHGIGFVWATILWDLTWKYIDKYGYDPDIYNGNGGNNKVLQLVIDGLKMTPCDPGFVDGRDALLAADMASTGGANQCIIWQAFANRGVGYNANQGNGSNRFDQVENFDMPPASVLNCSVGTSSTIQEELFQVYPNPAKGFVQIKTNQALGSSSVAIFDMNGRQVVNTTLQPTMVNTIDISKLNTGVYVIKIANENGNQTTKLMVE
ncbi:T9SS-dependent M36 family metallopeptidase [Mesonia sp. K7]|uniref:T9SS-dependent M36 family metallopeptidase n=1 Tax=Mesonia sp. K7 TaxID=2218606 RepID=UPI000DA92B2D|nr:T9SS-dependent M36 family metallopeptidase [Mesonia sp. K7]PZD78520.1 hypothetical protein DNG35_05520 [Mesonia sp. K7]